MKLEAQLDNPDDRKYSKEHEWAKVEGGTAVVGITDYAQDQLGDVVYVELPKVGDRVEQFKTFGVIESVKTASDLYAPVSGEVVEVNQALIDEPAKVNESPYDSGWMIKIRAADATALERELDGLMDAGAYGREVAG
jgi:glycine cleavage system H protein